MLVHEAGLGDDLDSTPDDSTPDDSTSDDTSNTDVTDGSADTISAGSGNAGGGIDWGAIASGGLALAGDATQIITGAQKVDMAKVSVPVAINSAVQTTKQVQATSQANSNIGVAGAKATASVGKFSTTAIVVGAIVLVGGLWFLTSRKKR